MALRSTQSLTEMSTRNISWGVKVAGTYDWQPHHIHVPAVMKSGSLNLLEHLWACPGITLPFYLCGANVEIVVVTTLSSDVYHLLHLCYILIKVTTTFWHECYLILWKFFIYTLSLNRWVHKYWVFWMVEFLCHLLIIFTMNCLCLVVTFTLLCPQNFVTCFT